MFLVPESDDPQALEVKRLAIRPGDRIVLRVRHYLTDDEVHHLGEMVERAFGDADYRPPILLLEGDAEIGVIGPESLPPVEGVVRQAALEALLSTGFDPFNARAVLAMPPEAGALWARCWG